MHIITGICRGTLSTKTVVVVVFSFKYNINSKRKNYPKVVLITDKSLMWGFSWK